MTRSYDVDASYDVDYYDRPPAFSVHDFTFECGVDWRSSSGPLVDSPTYTPVSADVLAGAGVTLRHGRSGESGRAEAGSATFTLDNRSGVYTPGRVRAASSRTKAEHTFETGVAWANTAGTSTATLTTTVARTGTKSLQVQSASAALAYAYPAAVAVSAGQLVTVSMWVRAAARAHVDLWFSWYNGATKVLDEAGAPVWVADEWTFVEFSSVAPAGATLVYYGPEWTAAAASETIYVDDVLLDVGAPTLSTGRPVRWRVTPPGGSAATLWTGAATEWRGSRDSGHLPTTQVTCTDLIGALAALELPEAMAGDIQRTAALYFPMDEGDTTGTTDPKTGVRLVRRANQNGAGGSVAVAARWDGYGALTFTGTGSGLGLWLRADDPQAALAGLVDAESITWECWVKRGTFTASQRCSVIYASDGDNTVQLNLAHSSGSDAVVDGRVSQVTNGTTITVAGSITVPLDEWTHVALTQVVSGSTLTVKVWVNGVEAGSGSASNGGDLCNPAAAATVFGVGDFGLVEPSLTATLAHAAAHPVELTYNVLQCRAYLKDGDTRTQPDRTDTAGERFSRLAQIAALGATAQVTTMDSARYSTSIGQASPEPLQPIGDIKGKQLVEVLDDVVSTCDGIVWAKPDGTLALQDVAYLYATTPALTFDARTQVASGAVTAYLSTQGLANDVTVTQAGGAQARAADASSVSAYGRKTGSATTLSTNYRHTGELLSWLLEIGKRPRLRIPDLLVNVVAFVNGGGDFAALAALTVGQRITVTNLPADAPASSVSLIVDAVEWRISAGEFNCTISTSPVLPFTVARLDASVALGSGARLGL